MDIISQDKWKHMKYKIFSFISSYSNIVNNDNNGYNDEVEILLHHLIYIYIYLYKGYIYIEIYLYVAYSFFLIGKRSSTSYSFHLLIFA
jgi:hypothetical protein